MVQYFVDTMEIEHYTDQEIVKAILDRKRYLRYNNTYFLKFSRRNSTSKENPKSKTK